MLKPQITLSDGNITLKDITVSDAVDLHEMLSDEALCDKAGLMVHTHINQTLDFIYEGMHASNHGLQYFYGIFVDETLVGLINFFNVDHLNKSGEYGYFISREHTRNGYMLDSIKLLSNYILNETAIEIINVYVDTTNKPSLRLAKKLELDQFDSTVEEDMQSRSVEMIRFAITKPF